MRRLLLLITLFGLAASLLMADNTLDKAAPKQVQSMGAGSFGNETIDSIDTMGLAKLKGTTVLHLVQVSGSLISQDATLGSVSVMGEAHFTNTIIQNGGSILGYVQAHNSTFDGPLFIRGQKSVFVSTKLKGITVQPLDAFKGKQIIELRQKTIVDGPITFESGRGEIYLYPGAQVIGTVQGGKIVKKP